MITLFKQTVTRPNRTKIKSLFLAALIVGALSPAWGQSIIYSTGFEKPTFLPGTVLAGQDGWVAPPPLSPNAAIITAAKKGGQTVRVEGADLESQPDAINAPSGGYYDAIGSYRHFVGYDTGGTQTVRVSADVRLDGRATPQSNFFSASIAAIAFDDEGGSEGVGELAISSD